jgi:DNA-binding NarL/FixJ family response regulator
MLLQHEWADIGVTVQETPTRKGRRIRILLLDHHSLFRESLARLLGDEPDLEVAAKCGKPEEAVDILAKRPVDVVLLGAPDREYCAAFFERARAVGLRPRVLIVAGALTSTDATELVRLGADAFFLSEDPPDLLAQNIRELAAGELWPNQRYLQAVVEAVRQDRPSQKARKLSVRERGVLRCVLEGMVNKEIAAHLKISESAVKAAVQQLFEKTGVHTRSKLVRVALEKYRDQLPENLTAE